MKQIRGLGLGLCMAASIFQKLARHLGSPFKMIWPPEPVPVSQGWACKYVTRARREQHPRRTAHRSAVRLRCSGLNNLSGACTSAEHGAAYVGRLQKYMTSCRKYRRLAAPCSHGFNHTAPAEVAERPWHMKRLLFLAALTVSAPAHATHPIVVLGYGTESCGRWIDNRARRNDDGIAGFAWFRTSAWVQGYLTASESDLPKIFGPIRQTDADGIDAWVDSYCQVHPLNTINDAASALVDEFLAKYNAQNPPKPRKR
jgi:hypothetical protein